MESDRIHCECQSAAVFDYFGAPLRNKAFVPFDFTQKGCFESKWPTCCRASVEQQLCSHFQFRFLSIGGGGGINFIFQVFELRASQASAASAQGRCMTMQKKNIYVYWASSSVFIGLRIQRVQSAGQNVRGQIPIRQTPLLGRWAGGGGGRREAAGDGWVLRCLWKKNKIKTTLMVEETTQKHNDSLILFFYVLLSASVLLACVR